MDRLPRPDDVDRAGDVGSHELLFAPALDQERRLPARLRFDQDTFEVAIVAAQCQAPKSATLRYTPYSEY